VTKTKDSPKNPALFRRLTRWLRLALLLVAALVAGVIALYAVIPIPVTPYMLSEKSRLGEIRYDWRDMEEIAPVRARSAVAAEDADFCNHWGFDIDALRDAIDGGLKRGGSTISQQVVKNVFLWQGRSWPRKALEALLTPAVELAWSKERILEVYLNVAEFDEGVFGVGAAGPWYFGAQADGLSARQAARLAVVLPNPKNRSASKPSASLARKADRIIDGAATIRRDGRAACFGG
jgi:monofunctional biosynthetic peptidoglycan transglycosylase